MFLIDKKISVDKPISIRAGVGARRAAALPNFGQLRFFWAARDNLRKDIFKDVSVFFY